MEMKLLIHKALDSNVYGAEYVARFVREICSGFRGPRRLVTIRSWHSLHVARSECPVAIPSIIWHGKVVITTIDRVGAKLRTGEDTLPLGAFRRSLRGSRNRRWLDRRWRRH